MIVKTPHTVTLIYNMTNPEGEIIDRYLEDNPLSFTVGQGEILPKLEEKLLGKSISEEFTISLNCVDAFGEWEDGLAIEIDKTNIESQSMLKVGMPLQTTIDNQIETIWITEIDDKLVHADLNHPFAGVNLTFTGRILTITNETK